MALNESRYIFYLGWATEVYQSQRFLLSSTRLFSIMGERLTLASNAVWMAESPKTTQYQFRDSLRICAGHKFAILTIVEAVVEYLTEIQIG